MPRGPGSTAIPRVLSWAHTFTAANSIGAEQSTRHAIPLYSKRQQIISWYTVTIVSSSDISQPTKSNRPVPPCPICINRALHELRQFDDHTRRRSVLPFVGIFSGQAASVPPRRMSTAAAIRVTQCVQTTQADIAINQLQRFAYDIRDRPHMSIVWLRPVMICVKTWDRTTKKKHGAATLLRLSQQRSCGSMGWSILITRFSRVSWNGNGKPRDDHRTDRRNLYPDINSKRKFLKVTTCWEISAWLA